jgi:hypothetical protein
VIGEFKEASEITHYKKERARPVCNAPVRPNLSLTNEEKGCYMAFENQNSFTVSCECGDTQLRSPKWLHDHHSPRCPLCDCDLTESRNEAMERVFVVETELSKIDLTR